MHNGAIDTYTYDSADKLQSVLGPVTSKTYAYHTNGRVSSIGTPSGSTIFSYDYDGNVTGISLPGSITDSFSYNGAGARVKRVDHAAGTLNYLRDGLSPGDAAIYDGWSNYSPGVSERTNGGSERWYGDDSQGALTDATDANGNLWAARTFDAFGNQLTGTSFPLLHGYGESGGYEEDHDSGLKLLGYRYYDPSVGRFLTPDPARAGDNWYSYCGNNPVGFQDGSGLMPRKTTDDPDATFQAAPPGIADADGATDTVANFGAGLGDGFTDGACPLTLLVGEDSLTGAARKILGIDNIDESSGSYGNGQVASIAFMILSGDEEGAAEAGAERAGADLVTPFVAESEEAAACEGGACFPAGTLVVMADGSTKPIEEVKRGDLVESRSQADGPDGKLTVEKVLLPTERLAGETVNVRLDDGQTITATPEHRFYVKGEGFKPAGMLKDGDQLCGDGNTFRQVVGLSRYDGSQVVYNLIVDSGHTYFVAVGPNHLWVHNGYGEIREAEIDDVTKNINVGRRLTPSEAIRRIQNKEDVIVDSRAGAKSLAKAASGTNRVIGPEISTGPKGTYLWHFHPDPRTGSHIFFW